MHSQPGSNQQVGAENPPRLSYKFQRLRERLRRAILSGEFGERLPGERALARRYHANAKTVNKALADLAAEGLLIRHIGKGTFVASAKTEDDAAVPGRRTRHFGVMGRRGCAMHQRLGAELTAGCAENGDRTMQHDATGRASRLSLDDWPADSRSQCDGLFVPSPRALSEPCELDEELILHACRRQTPMVAVGACAASPMVNAVAPDFVDGGFRLAEHLLRVGCDQIRVVASQNCRETCAILNGARTAAARFGGEVTPMNLDVGMSTIGANGNGNGNGNGHHHLTGLMLLGAAAIQAFMNDRDARRAWESGKIAVACFQDIGDDAIARTGMTAYECDVGTICRWAVRLMNDTRPGRRPVELLIPGMLQVRETIRVANRESQQATRSEAGGRLPEVAI